MSSQSATNAQDQEDDAKSVELHFELQTDRIHAYKHDEIMIKCIAEEMKISKDDIKFDGVEEIIQNEKHFGLFHGYIITTLGVIEKLVSKFYNLITSNRLQQLIIQQSGHDTVHPLEIRELYETDRNQRDPRWIELKFLTKIIHLDVTNLTSVNGNRFVIGLLHDNMMQTSNDIWEYYSNINEWKPFSSLDLPSKASLPAIVFDNDKQHERLFIIGGKDIKSDLMIIEERLAINTIKQNICIGENSRMVFINDELHIVGGSDNPRHLVWNLYNKKWDIIYRFDVFRKGLMYHGLVYIKSQDKMLMFGGYDNGLEMPCDTIHEYSFKENKWVLLNATMPIKITSFGYVITPNQRYILLFGGTCQDIDDINWINNDSIYVWDLSTMTFYLSSIVCPVQRGFSAVILNDMDHDQFIVFGYLREQCLENELILPHDIMGLILKLFHIDWIHLMSLYINGTDQHWKIAVDDIISSIS